MSMDWLEKDTSAPRYPRFLIGVVGCTLMDIYTTTGGKFAWGVFRVDTAEPGGEMKPGEMYSYGEQIDDPNDKQGGQNRWKQMLAAIAGVSTWNSLEKVQRNGFGTFLLTKTADKRSLASLLDLKVRVRGIYTTSNKDFDTDLATGVKTPKRYKNPRFEPFAGPLQLDQGGILVGYMERAQKRLLELQQQEAQAAVAGASGMPTLPGMPGMTSMPTLPGFLQQPAGMPSMPTLPGFPMNTPALPGFPAMPGIPTLPSFPAMPSIAPSPLPVSLDANGYFTNPVTRRTYGGFNGNPNAVPTHVLKVDGSGWEAYVPGQHPAPSQPVPVSSNIPF